MVKESFPKLVTFELKGKEMDIWDKSLPDTGKASGKVWEWNSGYSV